MKRIMTVLALAAVSAAPVAAQWAGMPVWNSPKGGTGVTVNGDVGIPNNNGGKGTAFGARGTRANANFGMLGVHLAYDSENIAPGVTVGTFGLGAHVALKAPIGM